MAQNLVQEAVDFSAQNFEQSWLRGLSDWWIYYEIPGKARVPGYLPLAEARGYVQAHDVEPKVDPRPLSQADLDRGLQWLGTITVVARWKREFDLGNGWQPWNHDAILATYELAKRYDEWTVLSGSIGLSLPATARLFRPRIDELPAPDQSTPGQPGSDPQASINSVLSQSLASIDECYRGMHQFFNDDLIGSTLQRGMDMLFHSATQPGGVCDLYTRNAANIPFEISVPLLPWLSVNTEKLCKLLRHPRCH